MGRAEIPDNYGMLFIWNEDLPIVMWMKDTPHALDMLFVDEHGTIVYIAQNATPYSEALISAGRKVRAVIELAGGVTAAKHIQVGDRVVHSYFVP